jgi:uncharacterized protein involved in exopolysaccharide biosynthesis
MSFSVLSKIVWARKLTFAVIFTSIFAGVVAFTLLVTPMFQSEALLMTTLDRAQRQQTQFPETLRYQLNSQIYIINSEDVLRQAIGEFGPNRLYPDRGQSIYQHALTLLPPTLSVAIADLVRSLQSEPADQERSDVDRALLKVKKHLAVNLEKDSQILSLTFRHPDPEVAEQFLGLVVHDFLKRQADLSGNAAAPAFFRQEAARYRDEYKKASAELAAYAQEHSTYSVAQEIKLALARRDDTLAALAKTRGSIVEKEAQAATYQNTVAQLRRRISLPGEIVGPKQTVPASGTSTSGTSTDALTDTNKFPVHESPLLLVKVFQETAQQLVDLNSQIVGLKSLEKVQTDTLAGIERKLGELSGISAEFRRLNDQLDQVSKVMEAQLIHTADAQTNADWDASAKLSNVKVAQSATAPTQAVFPPKPLFIALGAIIGLVGGAAGCAMLETAGARRRRIYRDRQAIREERLQDSETFEDSEWRSTSDGRLRERWATEENGWVPAHEIADYRLRRT